MSLYRHLADAVLVVHALFVGFVVIGQVLVMVGLALGWAWVRRFWWRLAHLVAIVCVVAQSWFGALCPLTILENALRRRAGEAAYGGSFIEHWLHALIFYEAQGWVFTVTYTVFAVLVAMTWLYARPLRRALPPRRVLRYRAGMKLGNDPPSALVLTPLERAVLRSLADQLGAAGESLNAQSQRVRVVNRAHSGVGFVTRLETPPDTVGVPAEAALRVPAVYASHPQLREPAEFLVQLKAGRLASIEAFCGEGMWPADDAGFRLVSAPGA